VECTTDNLNRTVASVRSIFTKGGGSLGTNGSLEFIFDRKGVFNLPFPEGQDEDELTLENKDENDEVVAESSSSEPETKEEEPKIIKFDLHDAAPEPEKQENISRLSAPVGELEVPETDDFTVREDNPEAKKTAEPEPKTLNPEENEVMERKAKERVERLRQMSIKLKSPGGVSELESVPAYRRKNVELSEEKPSEDSQISKYTLGDDEEGSGLKDNSFLHDNVD
jgi:cell division protein FtsZ